MSDKKNKFHPTIVPATWTDEPATTTRSPGPDAYTVDMRPEYPPDDEDVLCENCETRPATETWVGDGGALALSHGLSSRWCKRCCLVAQIEYANGIIERLPNTKRQLAEIDAEESSLSV